jgi:hypothetical protein
MTDHAAKDYGVQQRETAALWKGCGEQDVEKRCEREGGRLAAALQDGASGPRRLAQKARVSAPRRKRRTLQPRARIRLRRCSSASSASCDSG